MAIAAFQSARGLAHSKTLRAHRAAPNIRQVLDCGSPLPLFPPIVHSKMKTGKEPGELRIANCEFRNGECGVRDKSDFRPRPASLRAPRAPPAFARPNGTTGN